MSLVDHANKFQVDYSMEKVFLACRRAVQALNGFQFDNSDEILHVITLKAGMSMFSWGEMITITVLKISEKESEISILSTPKTGLMFGGAMDMGKNQKNINLLSQKISEQLRQIKE